jgi:hypothetical protein
VALTSHGRKALNVQVASAEDGGWQPGLVALVARTVANTSTRPV